MSARGRGLGGRPLDAGSPLLGGPTDADVAPGMGRAPESVAGAEDSDASEDGFDPNPDQLSVPERPGSAELSANPVERPGPSGHLPDLRALLPASEEDRSLDDWGRSERVISMVEPLLNFYYRYWFRVEVEGIENVPGEGGALLVSNHSGALPPDAPMVMQAIRNEHPSPRPLYMLGEHWFKGYPGVGMMANKIGLVAAQRDNAQRLLHDEGRLAIVFPEGQKGSRKLYWQRYRLRRFGRGGFVRTAIRARVPIVPIALVGGEEAMPIFAHLRTLQRLTGLIYFPLTPSFPQFGLAAGLMYLPARFKIRFGEPLEMSAYPPETAEDPAEVQAISEGIRTRIQLELDAMVASRRSVWFG
ncbi:MAG: lysophospholipid acyltransferase family protein [Solirubrobacterales bacterium]